MKLMNRSGKQRLAKGLTKKEKENGVLKSQRKEGKEADKKRRKEPKKKLIERWKTASEKGGGKGQKKKKRKPNFTLPKEV